MADGYRLPTEGEWQYAASYKDGTNFTPWNYASGGTVAYADNDEYKNDCKEVAWYDNSFGGDSDNDTHAVGGKKSNALGLHDMSGNVSELCWDWYDYYPTDARIDYVNSSTGSYRVERGGGWLINFDGLQVGYRDRINPGDEHDCVGFRLARRPFE